MKNVVAADQLSGWSLYCAVAFLGMMLGVFVWSMRRDSSDRHP